MGASIFARDRFDCTPLRDAIKFGHFQTVKILLSAGAHISDLEAAEVTNEMMTYVGLGDLSRIQMFVKSGANINLPWVDSRTPLHLAASENQIEIVRYIVDKSMNCHDNFSPIRSGIEFEIENSQKNICPINLVRVIN